MKTHEPGSFGELLKKFRSDPTRWDEKPPSQAKLADWLHVSVDTIQSYEQNKRFPDPVILGALAKVLKLSESEQSELASALHSTKEARRRRKAVDTAQTSLHSLENNETVPSVPRDPTETTGPSRNKGKLISIVSFSLLIAFVLVGGTYAFIISPRINDIKPSFISGNVSCANNQPVAGVWVDVFKGSAVDKRISGAAAVQNLNNNGSKVHFAFLLKGNAYNLHVGCGWSGKEWKAKDYTEAGSGPVYDRNVHSFTCQDIPSMNGYGLCDLKY